jgi:Na+/melibiose symporter-like transporter
MKTEEKGMPAIFRIAGAGASLAFGAMIASLFATRHTTHGFVFEINIWAVIAFLVSAPVAWFYWRLIASMASDPNAQQQGRKKFIVFSVGLLVVGMLAFLYPLKFVPPEKRKDVFIGLALAFTVLTGVGFVMLKVRRFLEADLKRSETGENR